MKKYFLISCLMLSAKCFSQLNIVPMPAEIKTKNEKTSFVLSPSTKIYLGHNSISCEGFAAYLNEFFFVNYGFKLKTTTNLHDRNIGNYIELSFTPFAPKIKNTYLLEISKKNISIVSYQSESLFNGIQTLLQLLPIPKEKSIQKKYPLSINQLSITDYPRFPYRGMHLDVSRHFYPVAFIKKYLDYMAAYKYNTFHWHLTEDQGWRIEIKKYPKLTTVGGFRNGTIIGRHPGKGNDSIVYGGFYTQQQIKEIVQYAAERYIDVVPEIELPGHASAAIAAYPQLSCFPDESTNTEGIPWAGSKNGKQVQQTWGVFEDIFAPTEYTFNFLQDVLDEVMQLFPSKYIHIGGDECPKEAWKKSAFCQQLIAANNLKDEHGLQSYFINRIEKYINSRGKKIIGWDEILEGGLAPNATVMSWRGEEGGIEAAKQNHDVIMTPGSHCYIDHSQSKNEDSVTIGGYLPLEKVYSYEPIPAALNAEQAKHVLGAQGNVWTEYMNNTSKVGYMIFPRMMALSEVLWSPKEKRNWNDFERRLPAIFERLDNEKTNYSKAYYDLQATVLPTEDFNGVYYKLESKCNSCDILLKGESKGIDSTSTIISNTQIQYLKPFRFEGLTDNIMSAFLVTLKNDTISQCSTKITFNKATGKKITLANEPSKSYPGDGAFTLVNGVQNEKGLARSNEFLGFEGSDLDATIDLGKDMEVSKITLHTLQQTGSWIYLPSQIEVSFIPFIDTAVITKHPPIETVTQLVKDENNLQVIKLDQSKTCRYVRVYVKNYGLIPAGKAGAGHKAWLFADEIEVD